MMQPFTYLPPQIDIHDAGLAAVLTNGLAANLLICAEDRRESLLALPEFAAVGAQIALGQKAPYSLVLHNTLQLLIFLPAHPARDHALYKQARGWVAPLAGLKIERLGLHLEGFDEADTTLLAELVLATLLAANVPLPSHKHRSEDPWRYQQIAVSPNCVLDLARIYAEAEGNGLARHLAVSPASDLTARSYREWVRQLAQSEGWQWHEYDQAQLAERGAGAFIAVARGSEDNQAAMVKLSYCPPNAVRRLALVGKGICHDSGGYNLKISGSMYGMHLDMGGSAVALGTLHAISRARLPYEVHCWLAIAENHIGPLAYRPGEVVTALNGTTIEVVDTDAEGRMVLADTLCMAVKDNPDLLIDYATLTGACKRALGSRYSGAFTNRPQWLGELINLGQRSGERIWPFPLDEDYDDNLDSEWADLLQCAPGSSPDHIDAARFLSRFVPAQTPWLHLDLSGFRNKGGNGVVSSEVTGFGVRLTLDLLAGPLGRRNEFDQPEQ
ncbi:M17 family metallopeptidase [Aeromonas hydrophila]|uniref:Cytosol aminopeptidase n=1 Tax=Aeromonas hydrophila subsp. hydrophila (strain ATCC 7966 / DSM 30187 / BCRC 13018 / CCUG 14551 / JCM 1027 / KCTC 2358 / NCIMB 9240 / NCTC 8049) TaxID=380703 RepID=A0KKV8_AERHH|nr:leucyl aminopeptidase family protein [Aeromonas hydrophila]ABK39826.1 cytosol aminopeptidase [Aeromonas hydrophila subsp. hydrophila ATCC 7966]MBS4671589.1 leucyl aminopeptidase family protein [Aeromonas hydrophila]OOD33635.1 peptidase M17 [Aeromonas hydrophila]SUU28678.1 cytosol aminopeptidase [Aeromonas hydrophila]